MAKTNLFYTVATVIVLGCLVFLYFGKHEPKMVPVERKDLDTAEKTALYNEIIEKKIFDATCFYTNDCRTLVEEFKKSVSTKVSSEFTAARSAVPSVISEFSSVGTALDLCVKAATDMVSDSTHLAEACNEILQTPIIDPCLRADAIGRELVYELEDALHRRRVRYNLELAEATKCEGALDISDAFIDNLGSSLMKFDALVVQNSFKTGFGGVGVVCEVIDIKRTYKSVTKLFSKNTCKFIKKIFAKPIKKIAVSIAAALVDGPIPVGDLLALGILGWTAYDIYDVCVLMPEEMTEELTNCIEVAEETLISELSLAADKLLEQYKVAGMYVECSVKSPLINK